MYNLLDRPQKITLSGGKVIDYKYAADGTKLQEKTTSGGGVVSAVINYGGQVVANIITYDEEDKKNKSIWDAFKDVDCFDIGIAFGEGFATAGGSVVKSGAKSGMKLLRSLLNASKKDVIIVAGSEVLSNTFDYEKGEFKVNLFKDVQYKTFIGLSSDLLIPGIDRSFRPFKTTTVNQNMKRARSMGVKYTPESYGAIKSFTEFSNDLSRGMNDVLEETANTAPVSILEEIVLPSPDDDDDDRL